MNIARLDHTGCALGNNLYIFGGMSSLGKLNNIEKLVNVHAIISTSSSKTAQWNLLDVAQRGVPSPRFHSIVAPLDDRRVLILGGRLNDEPEYIQSDAYVLNTSKEPTSLDYFY